MMATPLMMKWPGGMGERHTGSGGKTPLERQGHRRDITMALHETEWGTGGLNSG